MFVSGLGFSSVGGITFTVGGAAVTLSGLASRPCAVSS